MTPSEGQEEFNEIKEGQRRCEISTRNAKSQQELLKEDFKERAQNAQSNSEDAKKAQEDEAQAEAQAKAPKRSDESNEELKEANEGLAGERVIDPIEEVTDTTMKPAKNEEGTMLSMKNHEDKDFGDTMQIVNQDKADRKNDEELWGGRPSEVFKDKNVIMLKLDKMEKSKKFEYEEKQNDVDAMHFVNKQNRVEDSDLAHVINLEDFQDMVECIKARSIVEVNET